MKKIKITISALASFVLLSAVINPVYSQAFRKGAFLINISEGSTGGTFHTFSNGEYTRSIGEGFQDGTRDPFAIEYGLSKHWGIGLSSGSDFYNINPEKYYGFGSSLGTVKALTTEFTVDGYYHFMVTAKTDFSVVYSFGSSSVGFSGGSGDQSYQYIAKGNISRLGVHARFYIGYHFGFLAMASIFTMNNSTNGVSGNTVGNGVTTSICGKAIEFGICYRIKK